MPSFSRSRITGRCARRFRRVLLRCSSATIRCEGDIMHRDKYSAMPFSPIDEVLEELRSGRLTVVCDDEDRENEGDLVCPAESITPEKVNFMLRFGRGTLCVALTRARCDRLGRAPPVAVEN